MLKTTGKSGLRRASGGRGVARVSSARMGRVALLDTQNVRTVAFQPQTPQEHGFDSRNSRLSGLEK